jgi:hypothetical protein
VLFNKSNVATSKEEKAEDPEINTKGPKYETFLSVHF